MTTEKREFPMGKLIVFEGIDGSGKTTQANILMERLQEIMDPGKVSLVSELNTLGIGKTISHIVSYLYPDPKTEALLFAAAREDLLNKCIIPRILSDETVICDRFKSSGRVYSRSRGVSRETMDFLLPSLCPNLTVLLDISLDVFKKRKERDTDRVASLYNTRVIRDKFLLLWEKSINEGERWIRLDGSLNRKVLSDLIWEEVQKVLSEPTVVTL